jgi:hypothetical protein
VELDIEYFVDMDVLQSPMFLFLSVGAIIATLIGYFGGMKMGFESFKVWQLLIILVAEVVISYVLAAKG